MTPEQQAAQRIREWLATNPQMPDRVRRDIEMLALLAEPFTPGLGTIPNRYKVPMSYIWGWRAAPCATANGRLWPGIHTPSLAVAGEATAITALAERYAPA